MKIVVTVIKTKENFIFLLFFSKEWNLYYDSQMKYWFSNEIMLNIISHKILAIMEKEKKNGKH
jgi:hypothetical protein